MHALNFLAADFLPALTQLGERAGFSVGAASDLSLLTRPDFALAFVCGAPYVQLRDAGADIAAAVAPVPTGERYAGRPIYYADIVVNKDDPADSLAALRGARFCYNEPNSLSGSLALTAELARASEQLADYFSDPTATGSHQHSIDAVATGRYACASIDSFVLEHSPRRSELKVVASLGPYPFPPAVIGAAAPSGLVSAMLGSNVACERVVKWVPVNDANYDPVRAVWQAAAHGST